MAIPRADSIANEVGDPFYSVITEDREHTRYRTLLSTLHDWSEHFSDKAVLDYGCSWGTSIVALLRLGARHVVGVEPEEARVMKGKQVLQTLGLDKVSEIHYVADTLKLPFPDASFDFVLANAVFEHIPQPRDRYLTELWRVLAPGGHLLINETPNKYFPKEKHTTKLWFNHWLPKENAYRRSVRTGRYSGSMDAWESSGWRGVGFYELAKSLSNYRLIPETTKPRHQVFTRLGLPASLLDPYPTWVFQKVR